MENKNTNRKQWLDAIFGDVIGENGVKTDIKFTLSNDTYLKIIGTSVVIIAIAFTARGIERTILNK